MTNTKMSRRSSGQDDSKEILGEELSDIELGRIIGGRYSETTPTVRGNADGSNYVRSLIATPGRPRDQQTKP